MSISTEVHEITLQKIGETAGEIWSFLSRKGPVSVTRLVNETGEKREVILQAIGWLARENKIYFFQEKRTKLIGLIDDHGPC